jgi:excinuclease ABC subunit A
VIKWADRIIDLGPEGGEEGGKLVVQGTPEQVAGTKGSHTGRFLRGIVKPPTRKKRSAGAKIPAAA